ncbi:hypothetical protein MRB53_038078 [Persea americana]|nr:hypothetical protein MRB53_038078 [Persea americana]
MRGLIDAGLIVAGLIDAGLIDAGLIDAAQRTKGSSVKSLMSRLVERWRVSIPESRYFQVEDYAESIRSHRITVVRRLICSSPRTAHGTERLQSVVLEMRTSARTLFARLSRIL